MNRDKDDIIYLNKQQRFVTATPTTPLQNALGPRLGTLVHRDCVVGHSKPARCPAAAHTLAAAALPAALASWLQDCAARTGLLRSTYGQEHPIDCCVFAFQGRARGLSPAGEHTLAE